MASEPESTGRRVKEISDFSLICPDDGQVAICYLGRRELPQAVKGILLGNSLELSVSPQSCIRLVGMSDDVRERIRHAPIIYIGRVFDEEVYWSLIELDPVA